MRVPFADLKRVHEPLKAAIQAAMQEVIDADAFIMGPAVAAFETDFARFCKVKHAIGVASGTDALIVALHALGVGKGDEVIVPANTFIATSEAVTTVGASVRFVDVDPETYNIDVDAVERAINSRTRAIIPVHLYGQMANIDRVVEIARENSLFVIEDAAQAHGATWNGKPVGAVGDCACFSFYPGKNLGAFGDAGAIVTNDDELAVRLQQLRNHGRAPGAKYEHAIEGYNARIDTLQAAILRVKLAQLGKWNESRRQAAGWYAQALQGVEGITLPVIAPQAEHVFHLYVVQVEQRDEFQAFLRQNGVATGIHYPIPLHLQPAYAHLGARAGSLPVCEAQAERIVSLPMYAHMTQAEVAYVAEKVREFQQVGART